MKKVFTFLLVFALLFAGAGATLTTNASVIEGDAAGEVYFDDIDTSFSGDDDVTFEVQGR